MVTGPRPALCLRLTDLSERSPSQSPSSALRGQIPVLSSGRELTIPSLCPAATQRGDILLFAPRSILGMTAIAAR